VCRKENNPTLLGAVRCWPTARANDPEKRGDFENNAGAGLAGAARSWPTASARDWKGSQASIFRDGEEQTDQLDRAIQAWGRFLSARTNTPGGLACLKTCPNSLRQSATFTEHLMGLPIGWTGSGRLGMESYRWWRLMRSLLCGAASG
jgi:hypothetical protein